MLTPVGILREPYIAASRQPRPGQHVGVLDEQVSRRAAVGPRIEVRFHAKMDLGAVEGDEAVSPAVLLAGTETEPAVVGEGSVQVANREDRRYSRTHGCEPLSRAGPRGAHPQAACPASEAETVSPGPRLGLSMQHDVLLLSETINASSPIESLNMTK